MNVDPYDGYAAALLRVTRPAVQKVSILDEIDFRLHAEQLVADFEDELTELAGKTWVSRATIEEEFSQENERAFRATDGILGLSHALCRLLTGGIIGAEVDPPSDVQYACSMLLTRAVSVGNEILAMLRAGFPIGAQARWRTLYEIDVVAAVLRAGNRWTAARYVNHRYVRVAKKPLDYFRSEEEWSHVRARVERMNRVLIRRYGSVYGTTYGWAAELTRRKLGVERPQFWHLERIAGLHWHRPHLAVANHGVHADSIGGLQTIDQEGVFHAGARSTDVTRLCGLTVHTLGEIGNSIIGVWARHGPSNSLYAIAEIWDEIGITLAQECMMANASR